MDFDFSQLLYLSPLTVVISVWIRSHYRSKTEIEVARLKFLKKKEK